MRPVNGFRAHFANGAMIWGKAWAGHFNPLAGAHPLRDGILDSALLRISSITND